MVTAIVYLDEKTNRVLNMVKAKFNLKDKSQAINVMAMQYEKELLEPQLRPEYVKKLNRIVKGKHTSFNSVAEMENYIKKRARDV